MLFVHMRLVIVSVNALIWFCMKEKKTECYYLTGYLRERENNTESVSKAMQCVAIFGGAKISIIKAQ